MTKRGWCPSLHEPMATGDGLLLRVKPPGGVLRAEAARLLAGLAERHGNGAVELTQRAAIQLRGMTAASAREAADVIVAAGLGCADPAAERRRNVIGTPLGSLAVALERAVVREAGLAGLPGKFGFLLDEGGPFGLGWTRADVEVRAGAGRWTVSVDGGRLAFETDLDGALEAAMTLARAFLLLAPGGQRMRDLDEAQVWAAAGLHPQRHVRVDATVAPIGSVGGSFVAAWPFGAGDAGMLAGLADLAERHGDGRLHLTPWRSLVLSGVAAEGPVRAAAEALSCIVTPDDPLLDVAACVGQPGCASASVETRVLARKLARQGRGTVHVSGCSKGCARPGPAVLTLVGRDGRWDVVRGGFAGDPPVRQGLDVAEVLGL